MLAIRSTNVTNLAGALKKRDPLLLTDTNRGTRFMFDLAFPWCYSGGSPVPSNALIRDMAEYADGTVNTAGGAPTQAGGGFAFTGVTAPETEIRGPAAVTDNIVNTGQNFLMAGWFFLPSAANWADVAADGTAPNIMSYASSGNYTSAPDLVSVFLKLANGVYQLRMARQTAVGAADTLTFSPIDVSLHGRVNQIACWRNAAGTGFSVRNTSGRFTLTGAAGAINTASLAGLRPRWGVCANWGTFSAGDSAIVTQLRLYRGWVENLAVSTRNPITVLDDDFSNNFARFS